MSKTKSLALILGVLVMSFLVGYLIFAWTEPSQAPPAGNVPAPINVGSKDQWKEGLLGFGGSEASSGFPFELAAGEIAAKAFYDTDNSSWYLNPASTSYAGLFNGTVGIGTNTPDTNYKLDVNGKIATPYKKSSSPWPANDTTWKADIDKNGNIDAYDLRLVSDSFGCTSAAACWNDIIAVDNLGNYIKRSDTDMNGDGTIDGRDIGIVAKEFKYTSSRKTGDINADNIVNYQDLGLVLRAFGCKNTNPCWQEVLGFDNFGNFIYKSRADVNNDNQVDGIDIGIVSNNFEPTYFIQTSGFGATPAARFYGADSSSTYWTLQTYNSNNNPLLIVRNDGNVGIGTEGPGAKLHIDGCPTGSACLKLTGGDAKLDVGVVDPILTINGKNYATYLADFAGGTRIETSGTIEIENKKAEIDFENLKEGSDLWLFWQASNKNIKDLVVLLTPSFEGKVWYEKNGNKITIYGEKSGEVSYRFSAPRFDYQKWQNLAQDQNLPGLIVPNP
jgi:hypothetical protein